MKRRAFLLLGVVPFAPACSNEMASAGGAPPPPEAPSPWRSALYPEGWTPGFSDAQGRFLHDVSYAGYRYGEAPPAFASGGDVSVLDFGADASGASDSSAAFIAAIAAVAPSGGVVWIPAGDYRLDEDLRIEASGVVLRGAGPLDARLTFTKSSGMTGNSSITFEGKLALGPDIALTEDGAPRALSVRAADASSLNEGDDIAIGWVITEAFVAEHGMTGVWTEFLGQWKPIHRRTVASVDTSVDPHTITFDVPLRYPAKVRDQASVRVETGHLAECGVEGVSVANAIDEDAAWSFDRAHVISIRGAKDAWVSDVATHAPPGRSEHLMSGGVEIAACKRVTVASTSMKKAQNRGGGGNGYLFEVSASCEVLFRGCVGEEGRHNFIQNWDFGATGCVFLRCESRGGKAYTSKGGLASTGLSEFHHSLAMACLIDDCVADDGWQGVNRGLESSGAGHSSTECVFWRLRGEGRLRSYQYGNGYCIGPDIVEVETENALDPLGVSKGAEPADYVEGAGRGALLVPLSLYEDQRLRRLKDGA